MTRFHTGPTCGDGIVAVVEECDAGDRNSDTEANACRATCRNAFCGDGIVDSGESCDSCDGTEVCNTGTGQCE